MAITVVASANHSGNPTTSATVTIPTVVAGDLLVLGVTNRDATADPSVTDNDTGGNTWTKLTAQSATTNGAGSVWYKRATSGTSAKTITTSGLTGSCAATLTVYRGAKSSGSPFGTPVSEANASGNETQAGLTTSRGASWLLFWVFNTANDTNDPTSYAVAGATAPDPIEQSEARSTGGNDCSVSHASVEYPTVDTTGAITWAQTNGTTASTAVELIADLRIDCVSGAVPIIGTAINRSVLIGTHGIGVQTFGHGADPNTVTLTTSASGSSFLVAKGGKTSDINTLATDNKSNTYALIGSEHDFADFAGYGTALNWKRSGTGGSSHTFSQFVTLFDESTMFALELGGVKKLQDSAWSQHANSGAGLTITSGNVTTTGPAILVAFWWGSGPVGGGAHIATPDGNFSILNAYTTDDPDGYVQATMAACYADTPGTYNVTWTTSLAEGAQVWILAFQGPDTITASTANVPISGTVAGLRANRKITATAGAVAVTGTAATLTYIPGGATTYTLTASAGAVAITGTSTTFSVAMPATAGTISVAGTGATLQRIATLTASAGSVAVAGTSATFSVTIPATAGAVSVVGTAAALQKNARLAVTTGAVSISGTTAGLHADRIITAATSNVPIAGTTAGLQKIARLTAAAGTVSITGTSTGLRADRIITAATANVPIAGTVAGLQKIATLTATSGVVAVTGTAATLLKNARLVPNTGGVSIAGTAVALYKGAHLSGDAGTVGISGAATTLTGQRRLAASTNTVAITGTAAALEKNTVFTAIASAVAVTGTPAALRYVARVAAVTGNVAVTGTSTNFLRNLRLNATAGAVSVSSVTAQLARSVRLTAGTATVAVTGTAVALTRVTLLAAATSDVAVTGTDIDAYYTAEVIVDSATLEVVALAVTAINRTPDHISKIKASSALTKSLHQTSTSPASVAFRAVPSISVQHSGRPSVQAGKIRGTLKSSLRTKIAGLFRG